MKMIAAHMGNPWWEEACLVAWKHKNIYTEFSGGSAFKRDMGYWLQLLKPNGQIHPTVNKLILAQDSFFLGKDIPFDPRPSVLDFYDRFYKAMGLNKEQREAIDYKNFEKLLGE